jgi:Secretion system C-terminal sorting domain/Photosynthesis system II assembly factor YCF48
MKKLMLFFALITISAITLTAQSMNWTLVNTGTTKNIRDVSFINRDTGFIAGDDGLLKITTNGGASWTDLTLPSTGQGTGNNNNIKVAQFSDYGSGMIAGVLFFDKFTAINRTYNVLVDGWIEECGGSMFVDDSICSINNFHRSSSFTEYTAGGNCLEGGGQAGYFGGFCFTFDTLITDTAFGGWADVTSNVNDELVMVGEDGYLAHLGGFNYTVSNSGSGYNYLSVDWSDTSAVYAANDSGGWLLEKSTDGGNTFMVDSTIQPTFWYPVVAEMDFTDNDWGVMACASNLYYGLIITKRGNNVDFFGTDTIMTSTYVVDSTLAFVGGLNGLLYKYDQLGSMNVEPTIENIDFSIFPNPQNGGDDMLHLFVAEEVNEIAIYDLMGKVLFNQKQTQQGPININTGINTAGTYLIRIFTDKGVGTKKYVVN